jgi:arylsulfatase A-like enzyme
MYLLMLLACSGAPETPPVAQPPKAPAAVNAPAADGAFHDVVVITLDTTRADHLKFYGYFRDTAPRLTQFAEQAVVFDRLVVPMATTLPTHTSLFTGVYPLEHGVTANVEHGGKQFVPSERLLPFAGWLADEGYQTGGFTSAAPLNPTTGIERGFQTFSAPKGELRSGKQTVDDAVAWLGGLGPAPMLLWVHLYEPHNPYNPDEAYRQQFADDPQLDAWLDARKVDKVARRPSGEVVRARPTWNAYDAEIRTMDDQIARVLDAVQARGRLDKTVFIVMGDHGEGLNQHGEPGHGLVWDEQLHAPLLIAAPGLAPRRVSATVSAIDVLPTALAVANLPNEQRIATQMSGRDALSDAPPRPALSLTSDRQRALGKGQAYALTDGATSCRLDDGGAVLAWDLAKDPHQLGSGEPTPELAASCKARIEEMVAAQKARGVELGAGKTRDADPAHVEQLKLLGYTDDAEPTKPDPTKPDPTKPDPTKAPTP